MSVTRLSNSAQEWANQHAYYDDQANQGLKAAAASTEGGLFCSPTELSYLAEAQIYATLAAAAATRLLAETYDGHHS